MANMSIEEHFKMDVDTTNTSSFSHSYIDIIDPYLLPIIQKSGKIVFLLDKFSDPIYVKVGLIEQQRYKNIQEH